MKLRHSFLLLAATLLVLISRQPAAAELPLADPTRPAAPAAAAHPAARNGATSAAAPAWPQLQSVQVSAQGGSSALVDGRVVRVGERIGELTVAAIDAQGILLRGPRFEQRLALLPGVAKTASAQPLSRPAVTVATKELP